MCKAMERFRSEGKAEGIVEGEARGKRETMLATAKRMLRGGILALKDAECAVLGRGTRYKP